MKKTQEFDMKPVPLKRPVDKLAQGAEVAALNNLLDMMNNSEITGAEIPPGVETKAVITRATFIGPEAGPAINPQNPFIGAAIPDPDPALARENAKYPGFKHGYDEKPLTVKAGHAITSGSNNTFHGAKVNPSKIFFTGLIGAGKDFCAEQMGAKIFGLADPMYHLAEYFFGVTVNSKEGKQLPGMRAFLQVCNQYGRGETNDKYPYTAARACFISMIRSLGDGGRFDAQYEIDWSGYGKNADIWLDGLNRRVAIYQAANPDARVAVTNARFKNDYTRLSGLGWSHWHVMASPQTRASRVKVDAGAANDVSEQLANFLNNDVTQKISKQPRGNKLHVIWNCSTPSPSPRLYTVAEWLQEVAILAAPAENNIVTGE